LPQEKSMPGNKNQYKRVDGLKSATIFFVLKVEKAHSKCLNERVFKDYRNYNW